MAAKKRHHLTTRVWHWVNAVALIVLFMSGLNIFNAHPRLYWGEAGFDPRDAWLILERFPHWLTIPGYYSLADARLWHLFFAWVLSIGLTIFMLWSLINRHIQRDLQITRREWRWSNIRQDIKDTATLNIQKGGDSKGYKVLQKMTYILIIFVLLPLVIFTGITMSPAMNANWPWLTDVFGGRQSARSIHFIVAWTLAVIFVVHFVMVLLSGPIRQIRAMITGGERE